VRVSKSANSLMGRYLDVFVREAVARAGLAQRERRERGEVAVDEEMEMDDGGGGAGGVWLDTRDLEEVAPGLVLDF